MEERHEEDEDEDEDEDDGEVGFAWRDDRIAAIRYWDCR